VTMGEVITFPRSRVASTLCRSSRVEELEMHILEKLRLLQHRNSDAIVGEILQLREEIWRLEADEAMAPNPEVGATQAGIE
jgi:hypothetical protein